MTHTQSVERGVKKAGTVGKTGRSEPHRSALACIHSFCFEDEELTGKSPAERTLLCLNIAQRIHNKHIQMKKKPGYDEQFKKTKKLIVGDDHFSKTRINQRLQAATENGKILRHELASQKITGVDRTAASRGMVSIQPSRSQMVRTRGTLNSFNKKWNSEDLPLKSLRN
jgi:hypothetical protein